MLIIVCRFGLIRHSLLTKGIDWKYEKEWRIIEDIEPQSIKFNKKELISVIFGLETSKSDMENIDYILRKYGYHNVFIRRAKVNEKKVSVTYDAVKRIKIYPEFKAWIIK